VLEITAKPRRGRHRRLLVRIGVVAALLLVVALLTPAALGMSPRPVADAAMADSQPQGALVLTERVAAEDLAAGDVITFRSPVDEGDGAGGWVTRRIVEFDDGLLVTQGDAEAEVDPWLLRPEGAELGRVLHTLPWLGYPWLVVASALPVLVVLLLGGLLVAVLRLRSRSRRTTAASGAGVRRGARATLV
jgi:signal peptidase I